MSFDSLHPGQTHQVSQLVTETITAFGTSAEHTHDDDLKKNCNSRRYWDTTDKMTYNQVVANVTEDPKHRLQMVYRIQIPHNFSGFQSDAIKLFYKTIGSAAWVKILQVIDSTGTIQDTGFPAAGQSASQAVMTVTAAALTGTFSASSEMTVVVQCEGELGDAVEWDENIAMAGDVQVFITNGYEE